MLLVLEEGEVPPTQNKTSDEVKGHDEQHLSTHMEGHSPTYAEMEKKETYGQLWLIR